MIPSEAVPPALTRAYIALLDCPRPTVRVVALRCGVSPTTAWSALVRLDALGLVAGLGIAGGLRATYLPVKNL